MRSLLWGMAVVGPAAFLGFVLGPGCGSLPDDCKERFACTGSTGSGGGSSSSSASSSSSGMGGSGGDGGTPAGCIPSAAASAVDDMCGVFVSSSLGADANAGTKEKPLKTLDAAIKKASAMKAPVYACAETFTEALSVAGGVEVYGGLDCVKSGWKWIGFDKGLPTALTAAADAVPLSIASSATSVALHDFSVKSAQAKSAGGSSIAVIVDQAKVSFAHCQIEASDAVAGVAGTTPMDNTGPTDPTDSSIRGNNGMDACSSVSQAFGGAAVENPLCPAMSGGPIGGAGGNGAVLNGSDGDVSVANTQTALGGKGQPSADPTWSCAVGVGGFGQNGMAGAIGDSASGATSLGTIDKSGYAGVAGKDGGAGKPGQGGGGGGGAKGRMSCSGATGGSGGAGGCAGNGGKGGTAGGASIAILGVGATLTFDTVTILAGNGGGGGDGAPGQSGAVGGTGGKGGAGSNTMPTTLSACPGGDGGHGGNGGNGGGGRGGHVIGIALSGGGMPDVKGVSFTLKGTAGAGGKGAPMKDADPGVKQNVQMFP
jgi:hypothetical protein